MNGYRFVALLAVVAGVWLAHDGWHPFRALVVSLLVAIFLVVLGISVQLDGPAAQETLQDEPVATEGSQGESEKT